MKIEPYYQQLLAYALQAVKSREPISFVGMYDSAETYLFTMLAPLVAMELKKNNQPYFVDVCGKHTESDISSAFWLVISKGFSGKTQPKSYEELSKIIIDHCLSKVLVVCFNIGSDALIDSRFFEMLSTIRNACGWNFSYILFANTTFITSDQFKTPSIEKLIQRNICPIKLLPSDQAQITIECYEERYDIKLNNTAKKTIIKYAGGNPGIIKALFIQAMENSNWKVPDIYDQRLRFRLKRIIHDLPRDYQVLLSQIAQGKKIDNKLTLSFFQMYSFLDSENQIFSPLIAQFLESSEGVIQQETIPSKEQAMNILFSQSERKVIAHMQAAEGKIVSRDEIAKLLWGEDWADKYSDWAIDQLTHSLRDKIAQSNLEIEIKTKKGEGFIFLES